MPFNHPNHSQSALGKDEVRGLHSLAALKANYTRLGPKMGMCIALDPCLMNVFVGLKDVRRHVSVSVSQTGGKREGGRRGGPVRRWYMLLRQALG